MLGIIVSAASWALPLFANTLDGNTPVLLDCSSFNSFCGFDGPLDNALSVDLLCIAVADQQIPCSSDEHALRQRWPKGREHRAICVKEHEAFKGDKRAT
jgi:hypothetical protein